MGIYPTGLDEPLNRLPDALVDNLGVASPPFNVRDADALSESLGVFSLPEAFTGTPVMSTEVTNFLNFRDEGCPYLDMRDLQGRNSLNTMP